jgi:galactose mutarotase-like enzyme
MATPVELRDGDRALAVVYPELGGWLTRYARRTPRHGLVEALHHDDAVVARYPDRMWAGNPVLFPHVSFNIAQGQDGHYELNGQLFQSPQHGFARRVPWRVTGQTESSVTMEVTDSELTRPSYPFAFRHELTYRLVEGRLEWEQLVENRDSQPLPFSTGFHPYLPLPLAPGGERNRCFLRLPRAKRFHPLNRAETFFDAPISAGDFSVGVDVSDAWFLGDFAEREVALVDPLAGLEVVLNFAENPAYRFFALWSRTPEEKFYCLEPWTALPNSFGRPDGELVILAPGEKFCARLWMDVRET